MSSNNTLVQEIKAWLITQYTNQKTLGNYNRECDTVLRALIHKIGSNQDATLSQEQIDTAMKQLNSTYSSMRCYYALLHLTAYQGCQGCQSDRFHLLCKTKAVWAIKFKSDREEQPKKDLPITLQQAQKQLGAIDATGLTQPEQVALLFLTILYYISPIRPAALCQLVISTDNKFLNRIDLKRKVLVVGSDKGVAIGESGERDMPINDRVVEIASLLHDDTALWTGGSKNFTSRLIKDYSLKWLKCYVSPQNIRKVWSSQLERGLTNEERKALCSAMGHSKQTQKIYYQEFRTTEDQEIKQGLDIPVLGLKPGPGPKPKHKPKHKLKVKLKTKTSIVQMKNQIPTDATVPSVQDGLPTIEIEKKLKSNLPKISDATEPSVVLSKQDGLYNLQINYKGLTKDQYKAIMDLIL